MWVQPPLLHFCFSYPILPQFLLLLFTSFHVHLQFCSSTYPHPPQRLTRNHPRCHRCPPRPLHLHRVAHVADPARPASLAWPMEPASLVWFTHSSVSTAGAGNRRWYKISYFEMTTHLTILRHLMSLPRLLFLSFPSDANTSGIDSSVSKKKIYLSTTI